MQKKALLVGVTEYGQYARPLLAAATVVADWADLLIGTYQFPKTAITVLTDGQATKEAVLDAFRDLVHGCTAADKRRSVAAISLVKRKWFWTVLGARYRNPTRLSSNRVQI
jgi:hypothetical protein